MFDQFVNIVDSKNTSCNDKECESSYGNKDYEANKEVEEAFSQHSTIDEDKSGQSSAMSGGSNFLVLYESSSQLSNCLSNIDEATPPIKRTKKCNSSSVFRQLGKQ